MTKEIHPSNKIATCIEPGLFKLDIRKVASFVDDSDDTRYSVTHHDDYTNKNFLAFITAENLDDAMKQGLTLAYNFCGERIKALESIQNTLLKHIEEL